VTIHYSAKSKELASVAERFHEAKAHERNEQMHAVAANVNGSADRNVGIAPRWRRVDSGGA
jgi:hypothetical protein